MENNKKLNNQILDLFTAPHLRLNKNIIKVYGIDPTLWLADIFSRWNYFLKNDKLDKEGFFFITQKEIRESTTLNFNKQTNIIKKFVEDGIVEIKRIGLPKRNWYKINILKLIVIQDCSTLIQKDQELAKSKSINKNKSNKVLSKDNKDYKNPLSNLSNNSSYNKTKTIYYSEKDYSEKVQFLFEHWQSLKIIHHKPSKTKNDALENLNKCLQNNSQRVIKRAMDLYKKLLDDEFTILKNVSPWKVGLNNFLYWNGYIKSQIAKGYKKLPKESWFEVCKQGEEYAYKKFSVVGKDNYPYVTEKLKEVYEEEIGSVDNEAVTENSFRKAATQITEFMKAKDRKLRISQHQKKFPAQFMPTVIQYLKSLQNDNIHPGWLCSDAFQSQFPKWLQKNNYMDKDY